MDVNGIITVPEENKLHTVNRGRFGELEDQQMTRMVELLFFPQAL